MSVTPHTVVVTDESGRPLKGAGVELHTREGLVIPDAWTDDDGVATVPVPDDGQVEQAIVMPTSGHWISAGTSAGAVTRVVCPRHTPPPTPPWWHALLGKRTNHRTAGAGIRIGIVDFGFRPSGRLSRVRVLGRGASASTSHGARVARFLAEWPSDDIWGGVAPGADVTISAVDGRGDATTRRVAEAVEAMLDLPEPPHLLNLSLGFYREEFDQSLFPRHEDLEMVMQDCRDAGCLPVAAVGNDPSLRVALPAAIEGVVGVSSLGLRGTVPPISLAGFLEAYAASSGQTGELPDGTAVYPGPASAGEEVDAYGPGIGVVLQHEDGVLLDYVGTSYACPIVTGILALRLAADERYAAKTGLERTLHAERTLHSMCIPIRNPVHVFSSGLPRLPAEV
jgi:subtilisin family serine protease